MLMYYMPFFDGSNYFSVDNVRLDLEFLSPKQVENFLVQIHTLPGYQYYMSLKDFAYRHLFVFGVKGFSFSLGVDFNGSKNTDVVKGFLDFNPNKILGDVVFGDGFIKSVHNPFGDDGISYKDLVETLSDLFKQVLTYLGMTTLHMHVKRWDLACDVPVTRSDVQLFKDRRKYAQFYMSSEDFTEYLGQSDSAGRVKVYNKRLESGLDYDLTRIEVTLDSFGYSDLLHWFPEVYKTDMIPLDSDKIIVGLLREIPTDRRDFYVRKISDRRTKQKYKGLLTAEKFEVSERAFMHLVHVLQQWEC